MQFKAGWVLIALVIPHTFWGSKVAIKKKGDEYDVQTCVSSSNKNFFDIQYVMV